MPIPYKVSEFFKNELPAYGAYDGTRKIASYIDGFKNSQRKIIFTMIEKFPKDYIKTETLANVCAAHTNYLHGAANLCGVVGTMTQNFVGANNYPLLAGNDGGFGTRVNPNIAAARYTRNALNSLTKALIDKRDDVIIGRQFFEGDYIEPKFFVPIFPVLFLNGSSGLSTGFSQDIYPRNPEEVMLYIKKKLTGTEHPRMDLLPWFRGHKGKVEVNKETGSCESFGVVVKNNTTSYSVTELPIGMEYQKYCEVLDKLCENGIIQDYDDKCDPKTDTILFEIKTTREFSKKHEGRKLLETLKLIKSLPETLNCIDENGRVKEFKNIQEILDAFIDLRLKYYDKRKKWLLDTLKKDLDVLNSKWLFIKNVVDGKIIVSKKKKDEIIKQIEKVKDIIKVDGSYEYLLKLPIYQLTFEKMEELKNQIEEKKAEHNKIKETSIQTMWTDDLYELKKVL